VRGFDPEALVRLRKERGLSHDALAERTGWGRPNIIRWEKGRRRPSPAMLLAIADALQVEPAELTSISLANAELVDLRALAGLTQEQVARAAGIPKPTYALIEHCQLPLEPALVDRLASIFGVTSRDVQRAHYRAMAAGSPTPTGQDGDR
jgi:transcriptional regulator with XRE-family HTH domain